MLAAVQRASPAPTGGGEPGEAAYAAASVTLEDAGSEDASAAGAGAAVAGVAVVALLCCEMASAMAWTL